LSDNVNISDTASWLKSKSLQALFKALNRDGGEARVVGGAVRNTLLGTAVSDVDLATTHVPQETVRLAEEAGFKPVPTGIEHGTITVVAHGHAYEVTTLRKDVETDGRHAKVAFGTDWKMRCMRRRMAKSSTMSAGSPILKPGHCVSSAMPNSASARITCVSCAFSASSPGMVPGVRKPKACAPAQG
jgi:hypothetical protein